MIRIMLIGVILALALANADAACVRGARGIYFSFVTPTTMGYGDIVPLHPYARGLVNIEAIIGRLFPATLLARLVTPELTSRAANVRFNP